MFLTNLSEHNRSVSAPAASSPSASSSSSSAKTTKAAASSKSSKAATKGTPSTSSTSAADSLISIDTIINARLGLSAIHLAARGGDAEAIGLLISSGADPRLPTRPAAAAATTAAAGNTASAVSSPSSSFNGRAPTDDTPLSLAVAEGHLAAVRVLLPHYASELGIGTTLSSPATAAAQKQNNFCFSPAFAAAASAHLLCAAVLAKRPAVLRYLLNPLGGTATTAGGGAATTATNKVSSSSSSAPSSPSAASVLRGLCPNARMSLEGAPLDEEGGKEGGGGATPLMVACALQHLPSVKVLLDAVGTDRTLVETDSGAANSALTVLLSGPLAVKGAAAAPSAAGVSDGSSGEALLQIAKLLLLSSAANNEEEEKKEGKGNTSTSSSSLSFVAEAAAMASHVTADGRTALHMALDLAAKAAAVTGGGGGPFEAVASILISAIASASVSASATSAAFADPYAAPTAALGRGFSSATSSSASAATAALFRRDRLGLPLHYAAASGSVALLRQLVAAMEAASGGAALAGFLMSEAEASAAAGTNKGQSIARAVGGALSSGPLGIAFIANAAPTASAAPVDGAGDASSASSSPPPPSASSSVHSPLSIAAERGFADAVAYLLSIPTRGGGAGPSSSSSPSGVPQKNSVGRLFSVFAAADTLSASEAARVAALGQCLRAAVQAGNAAIVKAILSQQQQQQQTKQSSSLFTYALVAAADPATGSTAMHIACSLSDGGGSKTTTNSNASSTSLTLAQLLLDGAMGRISVSAKQEGASEDVAAEAALLFALNADGVTPLHCACAAGDEALVRWMVTGEEQPQQRGGKLVTKKDTAAVRPFAAEVILNGYSAALFKLIAETSAAAAGDNTTVSDDDSRLNLCVSPFLSACAQRNVAVPRLLVTAVAAAEEEEGVVNAESSSSTHSFTSAARRLANGPRSSGPSDGATPLHFAARAALLDVATFLVEECGADVNARERSSAGGGLTPLFAAIAATPLEATSSSSSTSAVKNAHANASATSAMSARKSVSAPNEEAAFLEARHAVVALLLGAGANPAAASALQVSASAFASASSPSSPFTCDGNTALHLAVAIGDAGITQQLLLMDMAAEMSATGGVSAATRRSDRPSPPAAKGAGATLSLAEAAAAAVAAGVRQSNASDCEGSATAGMANAANSVGITPLHIAAGAGRLDLVGILLAAGADPAARTFDPSSLASASASSSSSPYGSFAPFFEAEGGGAATGQTPLGAAIRRGGSSEVVALLLAHLQVGNAHKHAERTRALSQHVSSSNYNSSDKKRESGEETKEEEEVAAALAEVAATRRSFAFASEDGSVVGGGSSAAEVRDVLEGLLSANTKLPRSSFALVRASLAPAALLTAGSGTNASIDGPEARMAMVMSASVAAEDIFGAISEGDAATAVPNSTLELLLFGPRRGGASGPPPYAPAALRELASSSSNSSNKKAAAPPTISPFLLCPSTGRTLLHAAAVHDNATAAKLVLARAALDCGLIVDGEEGVGARLFFDLINATDATPRRWTAMAYALQLGHRAVVEALLHRRPASGGAAAAAAGTRNTSSQQPSDAAKKNSESSSFGVAVLPLFDFSRADASGNTCLHVAACVDPSGAAAELLLQRCGQQYADRTTKESMATLGTAAATEEEGYLSPITPAGLASLPNTNGETPLFLCCSAGHNGALTAILKSSNNTINNLSSSSASSGGDVDDSNKQLRTIAAVDPSAACHVQRNSGCSPLHATCANPTGDAAVRQEAVAALIDCVVSSHLLLASAATTSASVSGLASSSSVVETDVEAAKKALLRGGVAPTTSVPSAAGGSAASAASVAASSLLPPALAAALAGFANALDMNGRTPLHYLAAASATVSSGEGEDDADEATVLLLASAGADINAADAIGATPLVLAATCGNEAVGSALMARGADTTALEALLARLGEDESESGGAVRSEKESNSK